MKKGVKIKKINYVLEHICLDTYICTMKQSPIHIRLKQKQFESEVQQAMLSMLVAADVIKRKQLAVCASKDLTHSQYNILRILKGCYPNGYCRKEIIERMLEKAPDVTRLIDGLVSKGKAERVQSDIDKRMSLTKITKAGIELLEELHAPMQEYANELNTMYSIKELAMLSRLCGRIIAHDIKPEGENQ